jgi:hypothetical protein
MKQKTYFDLVFVLKKIEYVHKKMTVAELGVFLETHPNTLYNWNLKKDCPLSVLVKIADNFNIELTTLIPEQK